MKRKNRRGREGRAKEGGRERWREEEREREIEGRLGEMFSGKSVEVM